MIEPGDQAPDFTLPDQDGNPIKLSELRGKPTVVYFYPKADTPGTKTIETVAACPSQVRALYPQVYEHSAP